eukprot:Gb_27575 [translate_table: standard]
MVSVDTLEMELAKIFQDGVLSKSSASPAFTPLTETRKLGNSLASMSNSTDDGLHQLQNGQHECTTKSMPKTHQLSTPSRAGEPEPVDHGELTGLLGGEPVDSRLLNGDGAVALLLQSTPISAIANPFFLKTLQDLLIVFWVL